VEEAIAEGRRAVAIAEVAAAEDRKVEVDLAARHREEAIVAEVVLPAVEEARHHQTAMDATVNLLDAGWRPAFPPRSPSGGFARSLLLSWRVNERDENFFHDRNNLIRQWRFGDKEEFHFVRSSKME